MDRPLKGSSSASSTGTQLYRTCADTPMPNDPKPASIKDAKVRAPSALVTLSHELRTPLHGVLGFIEMLKGEPLPDSSANILDKLSNSAESLMQIFNAAVEAQRITNGEVNFASRRYALLQVVESAVKLHAPDIEAKGLNFSLQFDPRLLTSHFVGDAERQLQILAALLGNAAKFTDSGSITLVVALKREKLNSSEVIFKVIDTGIGIDQQDLELICDLGYQVETSQRGRPSGSGIGLFLVKNLLSLMSSDLQVESGSKGSTFSYTQDLMASTEPGFKWMTTKPNPVVRILSPPAAMFELMRDCLESLGISVEYRQTLQVSDLDSDAALTILDYRVAAADLTTFKALRDLLTPKRLVVMATDFEPATALLTRGTQRWMSPYLPSQLIKFAERAGVLEQQVVESEISSETKEAELPVELAPYTLLCVDDSPTNLIVLIGALTKLGFKRIIRANNGEEAVAACEAHPEIDLILMDFHMPRMNGAEASRAIRSLGIDIPILGVTALSDTDLYSQVGEGDFIEVLTKPVSTDALRMGIARHLPHK
ncbi:MAG TPA: response regulator [Marinobacterium sp.]|nr:response regulator [Marinobacterium sp.]